ncbi:MAG: iron ABC transporter permease [Candidatus Burarchaeum sp.]|nr:iron ABC transporter permease [Candidatus Burarchaeum sp.]MDO8340197.1 iron ABC transporter permease [Candidatus Burarchaeum sp.]
MGIFERLASNVLAKKGLDAAAILFFACIVLLPILYLLLLNPSFNISPEMWGALWNSFTIAAIATVIDVVFGLPLAWILTRRKFRGKTIISSLVDLPLVIPTSTLGLSIGLFWGAGGLGVLAEGYWLILALHIVFTLPYVVTTTAAAIESIEPTLETASRSLGATAFTSFRTIWFPLLRSGLLIGALLAFTRSLNETGATMVVAGAVNTVPTLALASKNAGDVNGAVSLSILLLVVAGLAFALLRSFSGGKRYSLGAVDRARDLMLGSRSTIVYLLSALFLLSIVLLPSFYFIRSADTAIDYGLVLPALLTSLIIAFAATAISLVFGFPMAQIIARRTRLGHVLDSLLDVVLMMPTVSVGMSLSLFLGGRAEWLALLVAHIAMVYPFVVKPISGAIVEVDKTLIEAARSLGAKPFHAFRTILLPLVMPAVLAGSVLAFMRSLSDTGATIAVSKTIKPVSVLIVQLAKAGNMAEASSASLLVLAFSLLAIVALRKLAYKR